MHRPFSNSAGKKLLAEVRQVFRAKKIYFSLASHFIFICGGTKRTSFRSRFLTYLKNKKVDLNIFRAEDAVDNLLTHNVPEFVNLAEFEDLIGSIFDCILIFPESPGSIAELGFFANSIVLQKKILVANDIDLQGDSFINLGPVALVESRSVYRPTVYLDSKNPDFDKVLQPLLRYRDKRKYRDGFSYGKYKDLSIRGKYAVVFQLIRIFNGIDLEGLIRCLQFIFGGADENEVRRFLSILHAAGFIKRIGNNSDHFTVAELDIALLDIEHVDLDSLAARALHYFQVHDPAIYDIATGVSR